MTPGTSTSSGYPVPVTEELLRQITQRIVEQSDFRIVLEGVWRFLPELEEAESDATPAARPEHSWRYVIYPAGEVFIRVASRAAEDGWPNLRVGYALALNGRSGFKRVAADPTYRSNDDTTFVLMAQPDRQRPDLLWSIRTPSAAQGVRS